MSSLTYWDHIFALIVFLIYPVYSKFTFAAVIEDIRKRGEPARIHAYKETVLTWIVFAYCIPAMWYLFDREWADLGVRAADPVILAIGAFVAAIFVSLFVVPLRNISRSPERLGELESQAGDIGLIMPRSKSEESWFYVVSTNAGLSEELIFRGYLIWYLDHFFELWLAAVIAVLLFGFAHSYQGLKQLPGVLLVSAVAVSLFVYTGSLLIPVLFHIFLDALQGHYIAKILRLQAAGGFPEG